MSSPKNCSPSFFNVPSSRNSTIAALIFASRWLQLPTYLGQIAAQAIYAYKFLKMLWHLISNLGIMDETPSCSPYSI